MDGVYYWLNVYSTRLEDIREELGLKRLPGSFEAFHITIGNNKEGLK